MKWARWLSISAGLAAIALMLGLTAFQVVFLLNVAEDDYASLILPTSLIVFNLALAIWFARVTYSRWEDGRQ